MTELELLKKLPFVVNAIAKKQFEITFDTPERGNVRAEVELIDHGVGEFCRFQLRGVLEDGTRIDGNYADSIEDAILNLRTWKLCRYPWPK